MARTKQTARKCLAGKAPRVSKAIKKKTAPLIKGRPLKSAQRADSQSESELELKEVINTQQFSLRFDDQEKCEEECVSGQIVKCQNCEAILTSQGKIIEREVYAGFKGDPAISDAKKQKFINDFENVWICQFCTCHNSIRDTYKPPASENPCFMILKSGLNRLSSQGAKNGERMLIFCIDISGSMDFKQTQGVPSRLESVKQAIRDQISRMKVQKDKIKVGLITFGSYVTLIGDGDHFQEEKMDPKLYHNFDSIVEHCSKIENFCQPINRSYSKLKEIVDDLSTYGSTALGPALLSAVEIASKGAIGSKIIICTDGEANVGIGGSLNVDRFTYYTQVADYAKQKSVMVNVLSLKGDKCNLKQLGKLSVATGGAIMKIDPNALGTEFAKITQENVLGVNSQLVVKMNKIFQICNVDEKDCSVDRTTYKRDFGNFTGETQLTFEFSVLNKEDASQIPGIDIELYEKDRLPMQIQLSYTGRDGSKFLQVITDWRELTNDVRAIYDGANFGLFAASVLQRVSKKIKDQQFKDAQAIIAGYWSLVKQTFSKTENKQQLDKFQTRVKNVERVLNSKMIKTNVGGVSRQQASDDQQRGGSRGRGGRGGGGKGKYPGRPNFSRSRDKKHAVVESDSEEELLWNQMRARSRSISPPKTRCKGKK